MTDEELKELDALLRATPRDEPPDTGCPATEALRGFITKTLAEAQTEQIHEHLAACPRCARDVVRLYRGLQHAEKRQKVVQQRLAEIIAPSQIPNPQSQIPNKQGWSLVTGHWSFRVGLAAAAAVLILALLWKLRPAPRRENIVRNNGSERKPAPQVVRQPEQNNLPPPPPQTTQGEKEKAAPQLRPQRKNHRPTLLVMSDLTMTEKESLLDEMRRQQGSQRSTGQTGEPSLEILKPPNYAVVLSLTPELVAQASGITGPFTFQIDEGVIEGGAFKPTKEDVAETKDKPVDEPSLTLIKPLERGRIYRWQVSAEEGKKKASAVFMVAEPRTADAAKKYAHAPLLLAEFYKAHGLYLDAQALLEKWLTQHPTDAKAQRMKAEIENLLRPPTSPHS